MERVEVNYDEISKFVSEVVKRLEWMDKKELISRFVSLEFNPILLGSVALGCFSIATGVLLLMKKRSKTDFY